MGRFLARVAGVTVLDAHEGEMLAGSPRHAEHVRDTTLWSTRSSRLG
jgi:hypothetical protein